MSEAMIPGESVLVDLIRMYREAEKDAEDIACRASKTTDAHYGSGRCVAYAHAAQMAEKALEALQGKTK